MGLQSVLFDVAYDIIVFKRYVANSGSVVIGGD